MIIKHKQTTRAFTLIEMIVVLAIMGMLAAVVVVSLRGPLQAGRLQSACEQIVMVDRQLRQRNVKNDRPLEMTIDLKTSELKTIDLEGSDTLARSVKFGHSIRIDRFVSADRQADYGLVSVRYGKQGQSPTYAVRISSGSGLHQWLLFAGLTGKVYWIENEEEIQSTIRLLTRERVHAS